MSRALIILVCGVALAGCTASGDLMKTATPTVPLQFESDPPGAEVKTSSGQTCRTPCALAVPAADMQVTYSMNGFQPQTVPVKLLPPEPIAGGSEESGASPSGPRFDPSPVMAQLVKATPRRAPAKKARVAKQTRPATAEEPIDQGFAPPPRSSTSGFNPPPPSGGGFGQPQSAPSSAWPAPGR